MLPLSDNVKILDLRKKKKIAELAQVYGQSESSPPETVKKKKAFGLFSLLCLLSLQNSQPSCLNKWDK